MKKIDLGLIKNISIRYKLIVTTLILILIPLLISSYDAIFTSDRNIKKIITSKLDSDLKVAWQIYNQELMNNKIIAENLSHNNNLINFVMGTQSELLNQWLKAQKNVTTLNILTALDTKGVVVGSANNPGLVGSKIYQGSLINEAISGKAVNSTEIIPYNIIKNELLENNVNINGFQSNNAMAQLSVIPLIDMYNNQMGILVAGSLINNNFSIVDKIKDTVGGTATIFQGDNRISTNVKDKSDNRAIGTKMSKAVFDKVLFEGSSFRGRAFVLTDWYLGAYDPIKNNDGKNIGALYVGVEEKPFNKIQKSFRNRVMLLVLFFIALGAIIVYFSTGLITKPIEKVSHRLKDIAEGEGDLTKSLEVTSNDEIGELAKWFNVFVAKLHSIIHKVSNSTNQLASAAEQLSASSAQISSGAEKQTSQTEHIATSMEEMSATIIDIAKNANEAAEAAKGADEKANKGGEIVKNTVGGMNRIAEAVKESAHTMQALKGSSEQIGEIIGVIDDIADQTNLLALNAAIEAARAGEQGRGFAVVADEVRKLAERTTKATKEIAEMIKSIQSDTSGAVSSMEAGSKEVEKGVALANEAGEALKQIVEEVLKVTDMVQQIATSTEEQSAATEEVSSNIESVSTVAKETSSGMEQSTNAIQELSQLATGLKNIVGQFKLKVEEEVNVKEE